MSYKYRHFKMACLASIAVLLGACSSTQDVKKQDKGGAQARIKQETIAYVPKTTVPVNLSPVTPPKIAVPSRAKPAAVKRKVHRRKPVYQANKSKVLRRKPVYQVKKRYVPPKPIVVAVHPAPRIVKKSTRPATPRVTAPVRVVTQPRSSNNIAPANHYQAASKLLRAPRNPRSRRPSLPRASAAMTVGDPIIRPARVPTRAQQSLRTRQAKQAQQLARAQWQKEKTALAYRVKWERDQQAKAQRQQARIQQARMQQARDQDAKMHHAKVRQQQANNKPQVRNAVMQRPVYNYSQGRLTGDFSGNRRAEAFVRMMASRHGFNPSYVAGVLSRAEATQWLRKQAYKDANPTKRTKKRKGPSWSNYRRRFITSKHINAGTAFYHRHRGALQRASARYGVPEEYILGILGVETIFGGNVGSDRAIDALATMGFMNARRGNYFTSELESYFLETRRARLDPLQPKASWAGALGLPQFMPSNIKKYGVDFDGDGAVNLWTPQDAIGSVANYLRSHGWRPGEIAAIPAVRTGGKGYSRLKNGFKYKYSLANLARHGLKPAYPGVSGKVNMVKLRTKGGNEYWVGGNNFYVITRYNHSTHYAMAVHQLAQEIRKRVKPESSNRMPRVIEASNDQNLLMQAANTLL